MRRYHFMHCSTKTLNSSLLIFPSESVSNAWTIFLTSFSLTYLSIFILANTPFKTSLSSDSSSVPELSVSYLANAKSTAFWTLSYLLIAPISYNMYDK